MSYIPKYILKRMCPKDAVTKNEDGTITLSLVNVISPIAIEEIPDDDLMDYLEVKIDGEAVDKEALRQMTVDFQGNTYKIEDIKTLVGTTIPVGEKLAFTIPIDVEKGKQYEVEVLVKLDNPINVTLKRTVN